MNEYDVIKQIGKGSFSSVHLCKKRKMNSSLLLLSGIYNEENDNELFIIKEINLDNLVKKYVKKARIEMRQTLKYNKHISGTTSVSITPYNNRFILQRLDSEEEYYYKRLKELIDSEIEILNKLSHDNIIKYYSTDINNQVYYIKMEYCQYGDLYSILKDCRLNDFKLRNIFNGFDGTFVKKYLKDTSNAIGYLHDLNIIHRDIKLHNILVRKGRDNQFLFKLSDFGFACFDLDCKLNESLEASDFDFSCSTLKKKYYKVCGTPYYMAPEIILNIEEFEQLISEEKSVIKRVKFYDKKVDLWSYGICLYELIFNMLPFSDIFDIHGLKDFFSCKTTQLDLHKKIDRKNMIDVKVKLLLQKLLTINPSFRISTYELMECVNEIDNPVPAIIMNDQIIDIINCNENMYQTNEIMKDNIMKEPLVIKQMDEVKNDDSWVMEDNNQSGFPRFINSWDKINKASSLIMKVSVDNNFMKWLLNKK